MGFNYLKLLLRKGQYWLMLKYEINIINGFYSELRLRSSIYLKLHPVDLKID